MESVIATLYRNLQRMAEAGTSVNATAGMVNAYTGETTSRPEGMDPALKEFYDTELLDNARAEMYYAQFAKTQRLPKNHKGMVEWRKWNTFKKAKKLQEGVIPAPQEFGQTSVYGTIDQYGTFTAVTDILELRACDDVILGATEEMGASMAETQETLIRDALMTCTNVIYCDNVVIETEKKLADVEAVEGVEASQGVEAVEAVEAVYGTPTSCDQMECDGTNMSLLTGKMVNRIVTKMKKDRTPKINGKYYAVIHPSVSCDLRESKGWIDAHKYASPEEIYNGEIGELHGCRFVENTFAPVLKGDDYKNKAGTATYATFFFGKDAYAIIDPEGGAAQMIIKNKGEIGGPLEQFSTIGYKFESNGATILYNERVVRVMSCSSFSDIDDDNYEDPDEEEAEDEDGE